MRRDALRRAPGDRYAHGPAEAEAQPADPTLAPARGVAWAALVAIAGGLAIVVLAGPMAVSLGLLAIAALIGRLVALSLRAGAGGTMSLRARQGTAVLLAVLGVLLGQAGTWLYARSEGGVLAPLDYLGQAFGLLVPAQLALAAAVAWWSAH